MASKKAKRYGQGGMGHKQVRQDGRPNGKAPKQYPKGFSYYLGRLVTTVQHKGSSFSGGREA